MEGDVKFYRKMKQLWFHGDLKLSFHVNSKQIKTSPLSVAQKVDSAIHQINLYPVDSAMVSLILIHWIAVYPMEGTIQHLNNQCQVVAQHTARGLMEPVWGPTGLYVYPCLPFIIHSQFTHLDWLLLHFFALWFRILSSKLITSTSFSYFSYSLHFMLFIFVISELNIPIFLMRASHVLTNL